MFRQISRRHRPRGRIYETEKMDWRASKKPVQPWGLGKREESDSQHLEGHKDNRPGPSQPLKARSPASQHASRASCALQPPGDRRRIPEGHSKRRQAQNYWHRSVDDPLNTAEHSSSSRAPSPTPSSQAAIENTLLTRSEPGTWKA